MRKIEIKILILVIAFFVLLSSVNESYARYESSVSNNTNVDFRTWKILINNTDVTENYSTTMNFTPVIVSRTNVRDGKLAPGSTGYFDILVNTSNVQTSYRLDMVITKTGEIDNLKVIGYSNLNNNNATQAPSVSFEQNDHTYPDTKTVTINNTLPNSGTFSNYYIRIFFKWIDNYNSTSTNENDTVIGKKVTSRTSINYNISVNLTFSQIM